MKLLVLIDDYPSETNLYSNMFAHVRVKGYISKGANVKVAITSKYKKVSDYCFEGVDVKGSAKISDIKKVISEFEPNAILVHFALGRIIRSILIKNTKIPIIIWVHGYEALGWYRRLFNFHPLKPKTYFKLASLIYRNTIQLFHFRRLVIFANNNNHISLVFVSNWMKKITETDCLVKIKQFNIVGNPIDDNLFSYKEKNENNRFNFLMIRPFYSKKYATDLVTDALKILEKEIIFKQLHFTIVGKGAKKSKFYKHFKNYKNIEIIDTFLNQKSIKELHDKNGVFLAISRQDAQGVSMCEALSSGLTIISSNNTAIPEYIPHLKAGILSNNKPQDIAEKIKLVVNDKDLFLKLSKEGSQFIREKVGFNSVINQELHIINEKIK
jgi:glycosyltransferase involved in cell wall biosynthesis